MDEKRKPDSEQLSTSKFTILNSGNKTSQIEEKTLATLTQIEELCKQMDKKPLPEDQHQDSDKNPDPYIEDLIAGLDKFNPPQF